MMLEAIVNYNATAMFDNGNVTLVSVQQIKDSSQVVAPVGW